MISFLIRKTLNKTFSARYDGSPVFDYPSPEFFGVRTKEFHFPSDGVELVGNKVFLDSKRPYKGAIVFFHGAGAGAFAYSLEIAALAKQGYLVYCYDNRGCMRSPGWIKGLDHALIDQKNFFEYLDKDDEAKGLKRYAIGHSWGGFVALAAAQEKYQIEKIVSMSGFLSSVDMMVSRAKNMQKLKKPFHKALRKEFGIYGDFDLISLLKSTKKKILYVAGSNDDTVLPELGLKPFESLAKENGNLSYFIVEGRNHNPYWSKQANSYFLELTRKEKIFSFDRRSDLKVDYEKLYQDDPNVLKRIFDFLEA